MAAKVDQVAVTDRTVEYFYDSHIGNFHLGDGHPMRPHRVRMTHHLVVNYGVYKHLNVFRPKLPSDREMTRFHSDDYIDFLRNVTPDNMHSYIQQLQQFNLGSDCPVFDGLYEYCQVYSGGSLAGANRINSGRADIVCNWAGGMHHAKRSEASGFCYTNDIVLAILEMLKVQERILYIDIDIHHGDGVEEAFYLTNRVMTLSFHQSGEFFPGTGHVRDIGAGRGKNYSINFPLKAGMNDESYEQIFKPVVEKVMEVFRPNTVVMCCGADSLSGDRVGCWNLSIKGHAKCLEYMKSFGVPLLILGGGGYTIRNVARCWAYETAVLLNMPDLPDKIPFNEYLDYYAPTYELHAPVSNMINENSKEYLEKTMTSIFAVLKDMEHAPAVQIQTGQPGTRLNPDALVRADSDSEDESDSEGDDRSGMHRHKRQHMSEFYDDDEYDKMDTDRMRVEDYEEPPEEDDH